MAADLRGTLSPARDQGNRGTCVAFAVTAAHEVHRDRGEDLSEEFLYWASKQRDGLVGRSGTTIQAAVDALAAVGQADETCWPYEADGDERSGLRVPTDDVLADAATRLWSAIQPLSLTVADLVTRLDAGIPVVLATWVYENWRRPPGALISLPDRTDRRLGRHAVLLVGYLDPAVSPTMIFRNSWGPGWGDDGYGYMASDYVVECGIAAWGTGVAR